MVVVILLLVAVYLIGAIPFGYLVGLARGVNLFREGSGNIGATNAARVLGRPAGVAVFVLDFLKGAGPVAAVLPVCRAIEPEAIELLGPTDHLRVAAAALAFLGHLFPIYLGFRGGKGVATGAGVVVVLVPGPAAVAVLAWGLTALTTRYVSLASLAAAFGVAFARIAGTAHPFGPDEFVLTTFVLIGVGIVVGKHRANVGRLLAGTENRIGDGAMRQSIIRGLHVIAVGLWAGGVGFFNFVAAPTIFESFKEVVAAGPSDRTAYQTIIAVDADDKAKADLANALAGSAVGPIFPKFFLFQAVCGVIATATAATWWRAGGRLHRVRAVLLAVGLLAVAVGWPISQEVTATRVRRFDADPAVAASAKAAFGPLHLVSLGLSVLTAGLAVAGLGLAAKMPSDEAPG